MANKAYSIDTLGIRAGMIKELTHGARTRVQIGNAIGIPTDEGLLHRHLLDLQDQMLIDRKMSNLNGGKPGTKNNPYLYFLTPNAEFVLRFLGLAGH
jgi:hypothetical protein